MLDNGFRLRAYMQSASPDYPVLGIQRDGQAFYISGQEEKYLVCDFMYSQGNWKNARIPLTNTVRAKTAVMFGAEGNGGTMSECRITRHAPSAKQAISFVFRNDIGEYNLYAHETDGMHLFSNSTGKSCWGLNPKTTPRMFMGQTTSSRYIVSEYTALNIEFQMNYARLCFSYSGGEIQWDGVRYTTLQFFIFVDGSTGADALRKSDNTYQTLPR